MNKTINANIAGIVFHLDENAYELFSNYLNAIKRSLSGTEGCAEIMQDIEARIAEMLQERLKDPRQVVTILDVQEVVKVMGQPEDFGSGEVHSNTDQFKMQRALFRDPDDKFLGGVCSGFAAYLNIDKVWVRLFFAVLFFGFGTGVLLYIILWIVVPEAKSTADRLRMRGEPVNLSNIEKNFMSEMEQVKMRAQKFAEDGSQHGGSLLRRFSHFITEIFRLFFKAVSKIFAILFLFIGLLVSLALFAALFAVLTNIPGMSTIPEIVHSVFASNTNFIWMITGVALAIGIPFLALAWIGAKMLFRVQLPKSVGNIVLGLWLFGIGLAVTIGVLTQKEFNQENVVKRESNLATPTTGNLVVRSVDRIHALGNYAITNSYDEWEMESVDGKKYSSNVDLDIVKSPDDQFHLVLLTYAYGSSEEIAKANASKVVYSFVQRDSILDLNRHFSISADDKWRNQRVQVVLQVPAGASIKLDGSLRDVLYDVSNAQNIYDHDMIDRTWRMNESELTCLDCSGSESFIGEDTSQLKPLVKIDSNGIIVNGEDGEVIRIDSAGISVRKK